MLLTARQAADRLGVKLDTLYAYVSRGTLQSYRQRVGRKRLYRREDIEALRAVRPSGASAQPDDDRVLRDVDLPDVESWAGEH